MYKFSIYFLCFILYSFLGWAMEMTICSINAKKLVSRGFLIGPYCPIYGTSVVIMILCLTRYLNDPITVFILAIVTCSIMEYFTSYFMEKLFHARWWDYSQKSFNVNGRICLLNSIAFGALAILIMYFVNPPIMDFLYSLNENVIIKICYILLFIFVVDVIISFNIINKIKFSFDTCADNTEEITKMVKNVIENNSYFLKRIIRAFPNFIPVYKNNKK